MTITVKNLRNSRIEHVWQVRIDRQSIFGNPFVMNTEDDRDGVCEQYDSYILGNKKLMTAITELANRALWYGKLELFCWCAPDRCHGDTIKRIIEYRIKEII